MPVTGQGTRRPLAAMHAEREKVLYTVALHDGTGVEAPGYLGHDRRRPILTDLLAGDPPHG